MRVVAVVTFVDDVVVVVALAGLVVAVVAFVDDVVVDIIFVVHVVAELATSLLL